jgi:hypothetical protein
MALFNTKPELTNNQQTYSEIGTQFGAIQILFDNMKMLQRKISSISSTTHSDLNGHNLVKNRGKMLIITAMFEALLSLRVFGWVLHGALNVPMTRWMWAVDFVVGMVFSWAIIYLTVWTLYKEKIVMGKENPMMGYFILLLVPITNIFIYLQTEDKQGELIFLALSVMTLIINVIVVRLIVFGMANVKYDEISKHDGIELEKTNKEVDITRRKFNTYRHQVEGISPAFVTSYLKLSEDEKKLVNYPVQYLYILQEKIFKGSVTGLIDTSKVNKTDYPFIIDWEKMESNVSLI